MTEPTVAAAGFGAGRAVLGVLLGVAGHVIAFAAGFVAARLRTPSPGGGFEDLAAAVGALLISEIILGLVCIVGGVLLVVKARRDVGLGLLVGWALGAIAGWAFVQAG